MNKVVHKITIIEEDKHKIQKKSGNTSQNVKSDIIIYKYYECFCIYLFFMYWF